MAIRWPDWFRALKLKMPRERKAPRVTHAFFKREGNENVSCVLATILRTWFLGGRVRFLGNLGLWKKGKKKGEKRFDERLMR